MFNAKTDQELMMPTFEKHRSNKIVHMFIAYNDPSGCYESIIEWDGFPSNENQSSELEPTIPSSAELDLDTSLQNPFNENEHVGVDEEGLYINIEPVHDIIVASNKEQDEYEDEDEDEHKEPIAYGEEDSPMTIGSTYLNMYGFKVALSQHAVKHEFEHNIVKSAPNRCIVYCTRKMENKCP